MRPEDYPHPTSAAVTASMKGNRSTDTKPEVALRSVLHRMGLRFRKDFMVPLPGRRVRVDVAFPRRGVAVFLDGCFWHSCPEHGSRPRANPNYWGPKLERNVRRDQEVTAALEDAGWKVVRLWEHIPADEAAAAVAIAVRD